MVEVALFCFFIFLFIYIPNEFFKRNIVMANEFQYDELFNPKVNADMVIFGTSKASVGLNPKYLEDIMPVYNFAAEASRPTYYRQWYYNGFNRYYKKPKVIIWCVDWFMFSDGAKKYEYDAEYWNIGMTVRALIDPSLSKHEIMHSYLPLFKYRGFLGKLMTGRFTNKPWLIEQAYKGYVPVEGAVTTQNDDPTGEMARVLSEQVIAFFNLLNDQKSQGAKIFFIQMPEYMAGRDTKQQEEGTDIIIKFAEFFDIPFIDYTTKQYSWLNEDKDNFKDWIHLSVKGAETIGPIIKKDVQIFVAENKGL